MLNWKSFFAEVTRPLTIVALLLTGLSLPDRSLAAPAKVFMPHLERIQQALPPRFVMRLPQQVLLGGPADDEFIDALNVRVLPADKPQSLTVGLYSCTHDSPQCLIGTFSAGETNSLLAQVQFRRHQLGAAPIQLTDAIQGYVLEPRSQPATTRASSIMWQQDGMFYTLRFATPERQNMLYMAVSMANNKPIYALNPLLRDLSGRSLPAASLTKQPLEVKPEAAVYRLTPSPTAHSPASP